MYTYIHTYTWMQRSCGQFGVKKLGIGKKHRRLKGEAIQKALS